VNINLRIKRKDDILLEMTKPPLRLCDGIHLNESDCIIICAGFEDRSLGVLEMIKQNGIKNFALVNITEYLLTSEANTWRFLIAASNGIVPDPEKGSITKSPGLEYLSTKSPVILLFNLPIYGES